MMRPYGEDLKVYLCREPVDMRKARNGLAALAQEAMKLDPFSGALMVFVGRRFNAVKILYWAPQRFCALAQGHRKPPEVSLAAAARAIGSDTER